MAAGRRLGPLWARTPPSAPAHPPRRRPRAGLGLRVPARHRRDTPPARAAPPGRRRLRARPLPDTAADAACRLGQLAGAIMISQCVTHAASDWQQVLGGPTPGFRSAELECFRADGPRPPLPGPGSAWETRPWTPPTNPTPDSAASLRLRVPSTVYRDGLPWTATVALAGH